MCSNRLVNMWKMSKIQLIDLDMDIGMCDSRADFKDMMSIVVGLPSKIQQQAEMNIKEAEEKRTGIHNKIELVNIESLDELMTATILPKFDEECEHPHYEPTKYLAALFEYWLRKGIFPDKKPNVHQIAVKFKCSITVLQSYLRGYVKPPHMQEPKVEQHKRKRVISFEETDEDTENIAPRRRLMLRKRKLREQLGVL